MSLAVYHGSLLRVFGQPRCSDGIWFAPVRAWIDDPEEIAGHCLESYFLPTITWSGDFDLGDACDGAWVRAALPSVFGFSPPHIADGRWFLLDAAFAAVLLECGESGVVFPFACTDNGNAVGLVFSRAGPNQEVRSRIASAFWGLLVSEGAAHLSEFIAERVAFDTGDGYDTELEIGYRAAQFYANDLHPPEE